MDAKTVQPYSNFVILEFDPPEHKTKGGLHLPPRDVRFKDNFQMATVLAVGPGPRSKTGERIPLDIKPGDRVLANDHTIAHQTFHILNDSNPRIVLCEADNCWFKTE